MSYYHDHRHTENVRSQFRAGRTAQSFAAVVGTVEQATEKPIIGRSGDHLQFDLEIGVGASYQVDVNAQSSDGSPVDVYIADQDINPSGTNPDEPFGAPAFGVFPSAQLSYAAMGLTDDDFTAVSDSRIEGQLESLLNASQFVAVYGMTFDDGGPNGKGIHETHFNPAQQNEDGALAIYSVDGQTDKPKRTWVFFKFGNESIKK